jgi:hypothetical protein
MSVNTIVPVPTGSSTTPVSGEPSFCHHPGGERGQSWPASVNCDTITKQIRVSGNFTIAPGYDSQRVAWRVWIYSKTTGKRFYIMNAHAPGSTWFVELEQLHAELQRLHLDRRARADLGERRIHGAGAVRLAERLLGLLELPPDDVVLAGYAPRLVHPPPLT